jgi:uncharacterized protein (TIRG00374 family)
MKIAKPLANTLKLLFTILLLLLVFKSVDIGKITHSLRAFPLTSLFLLMIISWTGQLLCAERWRIFASFLQMKGSYRSFVQMYFAGMFFNIGLPSLVGGDVVKAYIVSKKNFKPLIIGMASVLQDRAVGLISLLVYGSLATLLHPLSWKGFPLWIVYLFSWIAIGAIFWFIARGGALFRTPLTATESKTYIQRILKAAAEFHHALGMENFRSGPVFRIFLYSFVNSALVLWIFREVIVAAGLQIGIIPFSALFPLVTLATMLPITFSGIGVREWFYVEALFLLGVPREIGLVISLATSALILLCNFGGIVFLPGIPRDVRLKSENAPTPMK